MEQLNTLKTKYLDEGNNQTGSKALMLDHTPYKPGPQHDFTQRVT